MPTIIVKDVAGKYCLTMSEGQSLYQAILPHVRKNQKVELDFSGVSMYASPFFNAAIGQLVKDVQREDVVALVSVTNLSPDGQLVMRRSLDNAALYYSQQNLRDLWDESTLNI